MQEFVQAILTAIALVGDFDPESSGSSPCLSASACPQARSPGDRRTLWPVCQRLLASTLAPWPSPARRLRQHPSSTRSQARSKWPRGRAGETSINQITAQCLLASLEQVRFHRPRSWRQLPRQPTIGVGPAAPFAQPLRAVIPARNSPLDTFSARSLYPATARRQKRYWRAAMSGGRAYLRHVMAE
jgi:hypothetical protein